MNEISTIEPAEAYLPQSGSLSLTLPDGLVFDRWQDIGRELAAREKVLNWWIGDWWAFGEHRYGERAKAAAEGVFGKAFQTIANAATVCRSIETSRRREALGWSHHAEVAPLVRTTPEAAHELLDRAERENLTVAQVRAAVRELQGGEPAQRPERDHDSLLAGFLHHWNRLPREVRVSAAELIAKADGEEIEPA